MLKTRYYFLLFAGFLGYMFISGGSFVYGQNTSSDSSGHFAWDFAWVYLGLGVGSLCFEAGGFSMGGGVVYKLGKTFSLFENQLLDQYLVKILYLSMILDFFMEGSQKHLMALLRFLLELALSVVFGGITMGRKTSLQLEFQLKPSFFGHRRPILELVYMDLQI